MTGDHCPSCGFRLPAAVRVVGPPVHCPRCGDPLRDPPDPGGETATVAPGPTPNPRLPATVAADEATTGAAGDIRPGPADPRLPVVQGYDLLEVIGRGGMGVVYKARQRHPRRVVALKMILGGAARTERFRAEVAAVARLQHPNVVRIHEVGELDGRPYFSMEYVSGGTLADCLRGGPLPAAAAADLVAKLARAVQHAHDRGVVHRDLKPGNVLMAVDEFLGEAIAAGTPGLADCTPKIADFGLAKHLEDPADGPQTRSGAILGTPSYMAPEQAQGKKDVGPAADVYALGVILYECLTGRPPFREESQLDTLTKVVSADPVPPRRVRPKVPKDLDVICLTCLRKEPGRRYARAGDLADDLDRFAADQPIAARPRPLRERVGAWARRRREYLFLAAGAALAAGLAVAVFPRGPQVAPPPAPNLPPDLQLVPADSVAFATVRVADLWNNPAVRDVGGHLAPRTDLGATWEAVGAEVEKAAGVHPKDIERATFVLPRADAPADALIVLYTARPYAPERVHAVLTERGGYVATEVGGKRLYRSTGPGRERGVLLAGERVLVSGDADLLRRAATAPPGGAGPLTPTLESAAGIHTVVVGINPPAEVLADWLMRLHGGPAADPVGWLRTVGVTADVGHPTGPTGRVPIDLAGRVTFADAGRAAGARPHLPAAVGQLLDRFALGGSPLPPEFVGPLLAPVKAATWEQDGDALRATARVELDPAALKAGLAEAEKAERSSANMYKIAAALRQYHDRHGRYPPAVVTDADGKPLYSWRVELLPDLGAGGLYRRFHLNRAWDHPSNRPLLAQMPAVFAAPGDRPGTTATHYQVLTGPGGVFDAPGGRAQAEIADDRANTILFVEAPEAVPWSKPADVAVGPDGFPKLGGVVASGFHAASPAGIVHWVPGAAADPARLRALFTRAGGEKATFPR